MNIGERLKQLRLDKDLSILALSKELKISDTSLHRWENNMCDIKAENLIMLAKFYNVTTDYILCLED